MVIETAYEVKMRRSPPPNHPVFLMRLTQCSQRLPSRLLLSSQRRNQGQGLVEFALILPLLLLLVMGLIEFGYIFTAYSSLFNAAREGARYGVVHPRDVSRIVSSARGKMFLVDPNKVDITVAYDSGPGTSVFTDTAQVQIGDRVVVHLTYDLPTITPVIQPIVSTLHIETQAARTIAALGEVAWIPPGEGEPDSDGDGVPDEQDICSGFDDTLDTDGDSVPDGCDNCPDVSNPGQTDADGDGSGDACDESVVAIALSVVADPQIVHSGDVVLFTYTVTNISDVDLTDVTIVDDFGNTIHVGNLAAGATVVETSSENITTTTTNNVTATGTDPQSGMASDSASVTVTVIRPALDLTVAVNPTVVSSGEVVTFTYTVQNSGDADLTNVTVVDSFETSVGPVTLTIGSTVFWRIPYRIYETTTNHVTATGTDPLGDTVSDGDSATVFVELAPILIQEPLYEGDTVVNGTAEAGQAVSIRDLMSATFPSPSVVVQPDGSFEFAGLPPLVAGHVIAVEGYGKWDSAVVIGALDPIVIHKPLCHGSSVVAGTAEPGQTITLVIEDAGYQGSTRVADDGRFTFTLPAEQPLQYGQTVGVSGYGESASAAVEACTSDAYIVISPPCGPSGSTAVTVKGFNWPSASGQLKQIGVHWDAYGTRVGTVNPATSHFVQKIQVDVTPGSHAVLARTEKSNGQPTGGVSAEATFLSPCPAPNLVIADLTLLTTGPISTYQPLDFSVTVANIGTQPINNLFWMDLYSAEPTAQTSGIAWAAVSGLSAGASIPLTITLPSGFATTGSYQIWALADSWDQVRELDEGDNDYGPITVTVSEEGTPPPPPPTGTGSIAGETWVSLTGIPVPHGRTVVRVYEGTTLIASTISNDNARYELSNLPVATYTIIGETWIDGVRYSGTVPGVEVVENETTVAIIIMYEG